MVANPKFTAALAHVDEAAIQPLPHSRKVYARGSRADLRVPMREIAQADTPASFGAEKNPPIFVYDTSGPVHRPRGADRHPPGARAPCARSGSPSVATPRSSAVQRRPTAASAWRIRSSARCAST